MTQEETARLTGMQNSMLILGVLAGGILLIAEGPIWGLGGFIGGVISYLNFRWLRGTVESVFDEEKSGGKKGFIAAVYALKLVVLTLVLVGLVFWLNIPIMALLIGLGAMPLGIMVEPAFRPLFNRGK